ncbi:Uncharacterised protein [Mycobacteroides abscessus subsp. abscessus]|uniref:hypothetical protein n=1 Tax=Mycobacteroides abscessus TaxID=36809 RepID=UPI00092B19EA|nr:hypothetical protein [Mycobacteroides abscessus]SIM25439.1 Uncharacterised protein [Mycobacteroides abscessus subsp. abscessus]SLC78914.1 Uncharacterised protein [Mycobacteroides abscessus subsp. abscessus]
MTTLGTDFLHRAYDDPPVTVIDFSSRIVDYITDVIMLDVVYAALDNPAIDIQPDFWKAFDPAFRHVLEDLDKRNPMGAIELRRGIILLGADMGWDESDSDNASLPCR